MQFVILYIGILVFVFYQFYQAPIFHNQALKKKATETLYRDEIDVLELEYDAVFLHKQEEASSLVHAIRKKNPTHIKQAKHAFLHAQEDENKIRNKVKHIIAKAVPNSSTMDKDYVFIQFVMTHLPHGLIGLLLAVVFSAAMASTASELNSLSSTSTVDIYRRSIYTSGNDYHYVKASKWFTAGWALFGIFFASIANQAENLIQFVNIVGSLFYGTILGIFLSAFYVKYIQSNAIFVATIISEIVILYCYFFTEIAFLLYNIIGCLIVIGMGIVIQFVNNRTMQKTL